MEQTLGAIICNNDGWCYDEQAQSYLMFREDGTGDIMCRAELCFWIVAEFEWSLPSQLDQIIDLTPSSKKASTETKTEFNLCLTLTKRVASFAKAWAEKNNAHINERLLMDEAFLPKTFNVTLEVGEFTEWGDAAELRQARREHPTWIPSLFAHRLRFDRSPIPPQEQWIEPGEGPRSSHVWDWKLFNSQRLPESTKKDGWGCTIQ